LWDGGEVITMNKLNPSYNAIAQWAHFELGFIFVLLGHGWRGAIAGLVYASIKEGIWDNLLEDAETRGSGWEDWFWHLMGIITGLLYHTALR